MKSLYTIIVTILLLPLSSFAQGDLLITPKRVVFENNKQREEINLVNIGQDTATYTISFVQYNMKEDGSFVFIDKPDSGQLFADPYLRVFPRKVTLAPREPQVVSLQCRRSADMAAGEYRSHLYFRSEKNNKPLGTERAVSDTTKLKISLIPVFGLSIPVIIRAGDVSAGAGLTNIKPGVAADNSQTVEMTITRTGNASLYGDIVIQFFPLQGKPLEAGRLNNVGVYTNINKRNIQVKLRNTATTKLAGGKLKIQFLSKNEKDIVVHAEGELDIN